MDGCVSLAANNVSFVATAMTELKKNNVSIVNHEPVHCPKEAAHAT